MIFFRWLPWEYGVRNLLRRPLRTALTFAGLTIVLLLALVVVAFIRGLERTLTVSADPDVAVIFGLGMGENLEYSSIPLRTGELVAASVDGIRRHGDRPAVSPELFLGTQVDADGLSEPALGLVRGVTPEIRLVRSRLHLSEGNWPETGEILVGRLAPTKLGIPSERLKAGEMLRFEGREWRIAGVFSAGGSALESEIWCRLDDLQQVLQRQDLSLVAAALERSDDFANLDLFCKQRTDLELQAIREFDYYRQLQQHYGPLRTWAWRLVLLIAGGGIFVGLNMMYGAVVGRIPELAMLQTLGYSRRAVIVSLLQESLLLAAAATLTATVLGAVLLHERSIRFTMGAFPLRVDGVSILIACGIGLALGCGGAVPPAVRALRLSVVDALKTV